MGLRYSIQIQIDVCLHKIVRTATFFVACFCFDDATSAKIGFHFGGNDLDLLHKL